MPELIYGLLVSYPRAACLLAVGSYLVAGWVAVGVIRRYDRKQYTGKRWGG